MICLGIESTAHTFSCSVIEHNLDTKIKIKDRIRAEIRDIYKAPNGEGIHPRDASRHHMKCAPEVLRSCLDKSNVSIKEIEIVAYSAGPGLGPCLRVGAVVARTISSFYKKPLIPVNHAIGHIELGIMLTDTKDPLVLLVSGGHCMILAFSNKKWRIFGETLDITVGQLFDQFGRHIGYSSPCGNIIEQNAKNSTKHYTELPYIVKGNDVSFSGLLTASKKLIDRENKNQEKINDICYSLQETAFAMLTEVVERALSFTEKKEILIVGGVSANKRLSEMLKKAALRQNSKLFTCPIQYSGDNGSQIAWTGICDFLHNHKSVDTSKSYIKQSWRLDTVEIEWRN